MATAEQRAFLDKIGPMAAADMQKTGILASLTVAQAILESGWGKSGLTLKANNLFGIKGAYNGASVSCKTQEWDGSKYITITAAFRKYPSWAESVADHSALFLRLKRYENLRGCTDYKKACQYVREDGYATDPAYTTKLVQLIEKYGLTQYDTTGTSSTGGAGAAGTPGTSGGTVNTSGASAPSVGAVVAFTGNLHYTSANAANGKPCKPGAAKVTQIVKGAKHPYQLIREIGGGSTVCGWVDAADIATGAEAAILKLAALGVINSPDYWAQVINSGKVQYLGLLFEKAAAKITKAGTRTTTAKDGVDALVRAGVVDSPEYWLQNCGKVASLDLLLCALGGAV